MSLFLLAQAVPVAVPAAAIPGVWDPVTITLIGGQIVLILGVLIQGVLQIITHLRVTAVKDQQIVNTAAIGVMAKDTEAIKGHVNSEKTASDGREMALRQENALLREMLTSTKTTAQLLAQAAATNLVPRASRASDGLSAAAGDPGASAGIVQSLDSNTAALEKNTAASTNDTPQKVEVVNTPLAVENSHS